MSRRLVRKTVYEYDYVEDIEEDSDYVPEEDVEDSEMDVDSQSDSEDS